MKLFLISFACLSAFFLFLDFLAIRAKAKEAAKTGAKPGGTTVVLGFVMAFLGALVITGVHGGWEIMQHAKASKIARDAKNAENERIIENARKK